MQKLKAKIGKMTPGKVVLISVIVVLVIAFALDMMPKHISGSYTAKMTILGKSSSETLTFKGNQVKEKPKGEKGTYLLRGNKLQMMLGGQKTTATMGSDNNSFTVSLDGLTLDYKKQ